MADAFDPPGVAEPFGVFSNLAIQGEGTVVHVLRESGVPTIELRSSIVLGSGSLSFEMIRTLVERLPAMITPKWVGVQAQPIAIDDLLQYLIESHELAPESRVFEIGGADRASYGDLMREYARQRGLRRVMVPVPVLTPRLSSLWLGLVTPLYARVGKKLIESIEHPTIVQDDAASRVFSVHPRGMPDAIARAIRHEEREFFRTQRSQERKCADTGPCRAPARAAGLTGIQVSVNGDEEEGEGRGQEIYRSQSEFQAPQFVVGFESVNVRSGPGGVFRSIAIRFGGDVLEALDG